jgi:uncharacterized protein (TIGR03083 family)
VQQICDDLEAEHASLDALVAGLGPAAWDRPTPAAGWSVRDQISHLGFFDRTAVLAATDEAAFTASVAELLTGDDDASVVPGRRMSPEAMLPWWRSGREVKTSRTRWGSIGSRRLAFATSPISACRRDRSATSCAVAPRRTSRSSSH